MRKKLVMSIMMIVTVAAFITGSAVAAFMDVESSTSTSFQAGSLDLKTDDVDGITQTLYATSLKPGNTIGPATIVLKNAGSINATSLSIDVTYINSDEATQPSKYPNTVTADEFADELVVDTMTYGGTNLLSGITDGDSDGIDMKEVAAYSFPAQTGIDSSSSMDFVIQVTMKNITDNDFQADGIDIDLTFTLNQ